MPGAAMPGAAMPGAATSVHGVLDRSTAPPPAALRTLSFPEFTRTRLANGLEVVAARLPRFPLINVEVLLAAGGQTAPAGKAGLPSFHAALLDEGTSRRSAQEIARHVEHLGGTLGAGADWNVAYVGTGLLSPHLDEGLDLLAEIVRHPSFPEREIERLRGQRLADLLRRKDQPATMADWTFSRAVYGDGVYGWPLIGTEESVAALQRDDFLAFYRGHVGPGGAALLAVGDLEPERLVSLAESCFGDWPSRPQPVRPRIETRPLTATEVHLVDRPGAAQTQLQLGCAGVARDHPDHPRLVILNAILGGKFTSRINLNLRERHGYTYGASSQFMFRQGPGPFLIRTAVATDVAGAAVGEILHEVRRLRDEPVSEEELRETQDYLIGVFPTTLQTIEDVAHRLETLIVFGLDDDYYSHYPAELRDVTRDDVLEMARRHLDPDRLVVVAVGPAADLRPQLEKLGPVRVLGP